MSTIIFFGDWHGNTYFALDALAAAQTVAPHADLVHVGDFGLWDGSNGRRYLSAVNAALGSRVLYVVPGNHEFWPGLELGHKAFGYTAVDEYRFLRSRKYSQIRVSPRTNYWEWDGTRLASLAGANSIDFESRREGMSWWPEESPTADHVRVLVDDVAGRAVDVLVTHDAPAAAIRELDLYPAGRNSGWSPEALSYAHRSAETVELARQHLTPTIHVCGHHHVRRTCIVDGTRVEILADDSFTITANRLVLNDPTHYR